MDWHLIETFPTDAKWQMATMVLCCHSEKRWIRFGRYYGEMKRWYYSGTNERSQWAQVEGDAPTHWQPIPPLPPARG